MPLAIGMSGYGVPHKASFGDLLFEEGMSNNSKFSTRILRPMLNYTLYNLYETVNRLKQRTD